MIELTISQDALTDLDDGFLFYENQKSGLGDYIATQLRADIDPLKVTAGIHFQPYRELHRLLSRRFPYSIYYRFTLDEALVLAVVDSRRDPEWIDAHVNHSTGRDHR